MDVTDSVLVVVSRLGRRLRGRGGESTYEPRVGAARPVLRRGRTAARDDVLDSEGLPRPVRIVDRWDRVRNPGAAATPFPLVRKLYLPWKLKVGSPPLLSSSSS